MAAIKREVGALVDDVVSKLKSEGGSIEKFQRKLREKQSRLEREERVLLNEWKKLDAMRRELDADQDRHRGVQVPLGDECVAPGAGPPPILIQQRERQGDGIV